MLEQPISPSPFQADNVTHPTVEKKVIVAAVIGTTLEWYDLFAYLYFSVTISKLFFPHADPLVSLLATVGTFGGSYLVKPLGALVLSSYADRVSAKAALTLTVTLMGVGTAMIAFTPTYACMGVAATAVMVAARLIQGFSSGGEYGSGISFIVQRAPINSRGFYASFQVAAQGLTSIFAGLTGVLVSTTLTTEQVSDWGWRVPFLIGLVIIPVAVYIRRNISEVDDNTIASRHATPVREAIFGYPLLCVLSIGTFVLVSVSSYALAYYLPTYAVRTLGLSQTSAFGATILTGCVQAACAPLFGGLSDRLGRLRVMRTAAILMAVVVIPAFHFVVSNPGIASLLVSQCVLGVIMTAYQAPMPALLCDLFPPAVRTVGISVAHDFTAATFGGFTPFLITLLIAATGSKIVPGLYVGSAAALSAVCITLVTRHARALSR
ncbi:MFS transporter [Trinickia caryophylli]|uniref:MFS transporter, MHS family, proline/betaine transporter n=1 Tax=Trinickia caryophylli TaxID=28094 RepID=A0A1X7H705_TRICW|nr:MFS transporter [Trinickia caryophylli]PMS09429.1 MFS transporter [Trinickia caryophylli]WQE15707.1 MFS transporter [Trinickia caryophylli]GLU35691.1 MFS transporter [Trinickia caryophylli]SMF80891.1 MFS transporter, MHS family, proline/betaine transporter [Trinickia caryophylli]